MGPLLTRFRHLWSKPGRLPVKKKGSQRPRPFLPAVEALEDRIAPSVAETFVDDDWVGQPSGSTVFFPGDPNPHTIDTDAFDKIQEGIDNVNPAGNVNVAAGAYTEQLLIDQDLNILGAGQSVTTVHNPGSLTPTPATGQPALIDIGNGAQVSITDITVSGPGFSYADLRYGIYVGGGAHLDIADAHITHIRDFQFSGVQSGIGIRVGANFANEVATASITNVTLDDYQKRAASSWTGSSVVQHLMR